MTKSSPPVRIHHLAGVFSISITYIFFLIFAQFGFLELIKQRLPEIQNLNVIMTAMGLGGILASIGTALLLKRFRPLFLMILGMAGSGVSAYAATIATGFASFTAVSFFVGFFIGGLTVSLATGVRQLMYPRYFGLQVGLGTGLAYWVCNIPWFFYATPEVQGIASMVLCLMGGALLLFSRPSPENTEPLAPEYPKSDFLGVGFGLVILSFLALVWLDSAAFYVIQQNFHLKASSWDHGTKIWINGLSHFVFALFAGYLIDRKAFHSIFPLTFLFLVAGLFLIKAKSSIVLLTGPIYLGGVSLYSTALVAYPSLFLNLKGTISRRWRSAILYGVAGWFGSAMGIGMAQDLNQVPGLFLVISGIIIFSIWVRKIWHQSGLISLQQGIRVGGVVLIGAVVIGLTIFPNLNTSQLSSMGEDPSAVRGRNVYIQEGCIHCHTQYVRPQERDIEKWGPVHPIDEILAEVPPLIGNRRQGPDLLNVALRRSSEWMRVHLKNPQSLNPFSKMPSYSYLFKSREGEDLVAYLSTLGAREDYRAARRKFINQWEVSPETQKISDLDAKNLFLESCQACHGFDGMGKGPLASEFQSPPRNLVHDPFRYVNENETDSNEQMNRIIKFGLMGTSMPGHEYFSDAEIAGLSAFVRTLRKNNFTEQKLTAESHGEILFLQSCAPCHGVRGRGDGPSSFLLEPRPRDLIADPYKYLPEASPYFEAELKSIILNGIPGSPMPGNQTLSEEDLTSLIQYVRNLRKS